MKKILLLLAAVIALSFSAQAESVSQFGAISGGGGGGSGVTSVATTSPITGGTITTTGTIACATCVVASSPGAGIAHFAGSTQTVTSSAVSLTADVTGTLPVGNGGTGITSLGTGVATALGVNVGTAGAFVVNGGALGTPASGVMTNVTGTASGLTAGTANFVPPNVTVVTQSATPAINQTNANGVTFSITALAQAITSMSSGLTGTPTNGAIMEIQFTDNGTGRAIAWGASFASSTVALPTTTVSNNLLHVFLQYDSASSLWICIGVA